MSTQDTNHPTDPTPRTAATAREALEAICAAHYNDPDGGMGYTSAFAVVHVQQGHSTAYSSDVPQTTQAVSKVPYPADGLIALAAAEAPGRVAALVSDSAMAMESWHNIKAAQGLGFHSNSWSACKVPLCRRWVAALTAPAPTPSEPVERVDGWMTEKCSNCPHVKGRHLPDWGCMVPDASGPCGCTLSFTPATRDE